LRDAALAAGEEEEGPEGGRCGGGLVILKSGPVIPVKKLAEECASRCGSHFAGRQTKKGVVGMRGG